MPIHFYCSALLIALFSLFLDEDEKEMQKFSKNYLPILFNLYMAESENGTDRASLPVLETIKAYTRITDKTVCVLYLNLSVNFD